MIRGGDGSANTGVVADGPVLVKGRSTNDRRLVDLLVLVDLIRTSIAGNRALVGQTGGGVVVTIVLENVVLYKWILGPAIDREVGVPTGLEGTRVGDSPMTIVLERLCRTKSISYE